MLGPLEVHDRGDVIRVGGRRQRLVLAVLLLNANEVVSTDRLIDDVWGDYPPSTARKSLQAYVSRLRGILGDSAIEPASPGYVLRVDPRQLDAERFAELVRRGRESIEADPALAADLLRDALGMWRGGPLADLADEPSLRPAITRLQDQRLAAVEDRIEADLGLGRQSILVGELESLIQRHPLRERPRGQLMLALYRSGRQAEALRVYQETRRVLGEELGIEPSRDLQQLEGQILNQDPTLALVDHAAAETVEPVSNPYKGLRAFTEDDAGDFFGREKLIADMLAQLAEGRLLAVIGPSGSGKSSAVRAGLIPALKAASLPASEGWCYATMVPGAHPFEALRATLVRACPTSVDGSALQFLGDDLDLLRAVLLMLPDDDSELLLFIDQFEELFLLVDDDNVRQRFIRNLIEALEDPHSRLRVVLTLRADFYDRPFHYAELAAWIEQGQITVRPLGPGDLDRAAVQPAAQVGVGFELDLAAELVSDVANQPGALPLFQYTLTELFDRRDGPTLTLGEYLAFGGLHGALRHRADEVFGSLNADEQAIARQVFLRLVTLGEGTEDTRRRVPRAELEALEPAEGRADAVLAAFGAHRLLTFDRDPITGWPTVDLAHEALLKEWPQLAGWIAAARDDLRVHRGLAMECSEWQAAACHPDYLLTGARLASFEQWSMETGLALTSAERDYLDSSLQRRTEEEAAEQARRRRETELEHRSVSRLWGLVAVLALAAVVASALAVYSIDRRREADRQTNLAMLAEAQTLAQSLSYASIANLSEDPQLSLLLALHAVNILGQLNEAVPSETIEALHWAFQASGGSYPLAEGPAAALTAPSGKRGVYILPIDQLVSVALQRVDRSMTVAECAEFFVTGQCPQLPAQMPGPLTEAGPLQPTSLAGTQVEIHTIHSPQAEDGYQSEMGVFQEGTGIQVIPHAPVDFEGGLDDLLATEQFPDVAVLTQPGIVPVLVEAEVLIDLSVYVDVEALKQQYSPYLVSLGTVGADGSWPSDGGGFYAGMIDLSSKSLVWYPVPEFRESGYQIPETWDDLLELSDQMLADGVSPWCWGEESFDADGWPGTDWIEDLVMREGGPDVYDDWVSGVVPFSDPQVEIAFERLGELLFHDGYLYRGREGAIQQYPWQALTDLAWDPPECWLHHYPSYGAEDIPFGQAQVFPTPAIAEQGRAGVVGGGSLIVVFADRPEVRTLVKYLLGPDFGRMWADEWVGFISARRDFDLDNYTVYGEPNDLTRPMAEAVQRALAADAFRFDGSDLMPPEVGLAPFWSAIVDYVAHGPDNLDTLLAELDAAWPAQ